MINLPASNSCLSFSSSKLSLAEVTRASARGAAFLPRTGEDTWEAAGEASGEARGEAAAELEGEASGEAAAEVEGEFDKDLPPFNLLNALHKEDDGCCDCEVWTVFTLSHHLMACPHLCQRRLARKAFRLSVLMIL